MARRPPDDPRVTDLRRYRREREKARKRPQATRPPGASFLGSNPRAGLILAVVALVLAALYVIPRFL